LSRASSAERSTGRPDVFGAAGYGFWPS
jgi:hypothetical protein